MQRTAAVLVSIAIIAVGYAATAGHAAGKGRTPDFPTGYDPIRLAGHFVAYGSYSDCAADYCDPNNVMVEDLSNGKRTFADGSDLEVSSAPLG